MLSSSVDPGVSFRVFKSLKLACNLNTPAPWSLVPTLENKRKNHVVLLIKVHGKRIVILAEPHHAQKVVSTPPGAVGVCMSSSRDISIANLACSQVQTIRVPHAPFDCTTAS